MFTQTHIATVRPSNVKTNSSQTSSKCQNPIKCIFGRVFATPSSPPSRQHYPSCARLTNSSLRTRRAIVPSAADSSTVAAPNDANALQDFLAWLVANGTEGIGTEESKIGLYNGENGERGVLCVAPIKKGELLARIPLRLAITDHPDDDESNSLVYQGAPWSVRLASKLLRLRAQGVNCPWFPYIKVLPDLVPTPLVTFGWEDFQALGFEYMQDKCDHATFLTRAYDSLSPEAVAGATREEFLWALSVVHSRTFAGAAAGGGVGVRMLIPLIDMLNHAGDESNAPYGAPDPDAQAIDNCRWDLVCNIQKDWFLVLTSTAEVDPGQEVLLSYGERSNDDFFLFYGFVPPRNPHDDVPLFKDVEEAIDWHLEKFIPKNTLSANQLQAAIMSAFAAAEAENETSPETEKALESLDASDAAAAKMFMSTLKMASAGRIDGRILAAFQSLYDAARLAGSTNIAAADRLAYVRRAVGERSKEMLDAMPATLLDDLEYLARWEVEQDPEGSRRHNFIGALQYYQLNIAEFHRRQAELKKQKQQQESAGGSNTAAGTSNNNNSTESTASQGGKKSSPFVDIEPSTSTLPTTSRSSSSPSTFNTTTAAADLNTTTEDDTRSNLKKLSSGVIDAGVISTAGDDAALMEAIFADRAKRESTRTLSGGGGDTEEDALAREAVSMSKESKTLLVTMFRAYKKMILWDAVIDGL